MSLASGCCFMPAAYIGTFLKNPSSREQVTGGSPRGKQSAVNHRQQLALGPASLSCGKTTRLLSTRILQQGFGGLFHPPPPPPSANPPFLQEGEAEPPALIEEMKWKLGFHRLFAAAGIGTLLHLPASPASAPGGKESSNPDLREGNVVIF